jgi:excinuclease ABC subunit C
MVSELKEVIAALPDEPGVYQYFDKFGKIIYVGKAKNLKKRVSSYFTKNHENNKTSILVKKISEIRHIVVNSEPDALLLENVLIKKYQPRYNILLKDDKTYPSICIKNEPFPRVFATRNLIKDGSSYFGPYTSVRMVRSILDFIKQLYKLRNCTLSLTKENIDSAKFKVCLEFHIGNCKAPCIGKLTEEEYNEYIFEVKNILKGNVNSVLQYIKNQMNKLAEEYKFEQAANLKERYDLIQNYQKKSICVNTSISNIDVFSIDNSADLAYVNFLKVVDGAIIQSHTVEIKKRLDESDDYLLTYSIAEIRERFDSLSEEIIVPFLPEIVIGNIKYTVPQRGDKKLLLDLSQRNIKFFKQEREVQLSKSNPQLRVDRVLETMKKDLRLTEYPIHIECFDNSNIQGTNPVASCVVFRNTKPAKKDYRHFNIKTVEGPNDFASMEEIIYRRYKRLLDEETPLPQLIVIDGGKGQLSSAMQSLEKLGLMGKVAIIGIAKRLEEIYFPGDSIPIYLDKNSESLRIIQQLRNEAHRFGITFHRKKRSQSMINSELTNIDGIGDKTMEQLFKSFKTMKKIKNAGLDELAVVVGKSKAEIIFNHFKPASNETSQS